MKLKEVRFFCTVIIELVPIKQHLSCQKGLLSILVFSVSCFFVKHEFLVLFPSLSFCLTASVAPPLLCPCCWPWAVRCQSLAGGFLHETGCLQGPICGSSPQTNEYIGWYAVSDCIYSKCYILGSIRQRIHIETQGRGEVCLSVIFSSTVKSIRTKADVY